MNLYTFQDKTENYSPLRVLAGSLPEAIYILGTSKTTRNVNPIINVSQLLVSNKISGDTFLDAIDQIYYADATLPGIISINDDAHDRNQIIPDEDVLEAVNTILESRHSIKELDQVRKQVLLQPGSSRYKALEATNSLSEKTKQELLQIGKDLNLNVKSKQTKEEIIRILQKYYDN